MKYLVLMKYLIYGIIEKFDTLGEPGLTTYLPHYPVVNLVEPQQKFA